MNEHHEQNDLTASVETAARDRTIENKSIGIDRPWFRLHASTYVAMLLTGTVLFFLNVPGQYTVHLSAGFGPQTAFSNLDQYIEHGWPAVYVSRFATERTSLYALPARPSVWRITDDVVEFNRSILALDAASALFIVGLVAALWERRRRRRWRLWQLSIADLFASVAVVGSICGYLAWQHQEYEDEQKAVRSLVDGNIVERQDAFGGFWMGDNCCVAWQNELPSWITEFVKSNWSHWFDRVVYAAISPKSLSENSCSPQGSDCELKMQKAHVVDGFLFPADQQSSCTIDPGVCAFDDPTSRFAAATFGQGSVFSFLGNVNDVPATPARLSNRLGVVSFVAAEMLLVVQRRPWATNGNAVQRTFDQFLIMHIGAGNGDANRNTRRVGQHRGNRSADRVLPRMLG
jgi:hypothetical protein